MLILFACLITYLYGSIPFSLLVGKCYGVDIRNVGSGNIGGSNLGRSCGKLSFVYGFVLDMSKGALTVLLSNLLNIDPLILLVFALLGHGFSVFIKFKGGKGIATSFGFSVAYSPISALIAIIIFLIVLKISKYVSLSSIIAIFAYFILSLFNDNYIFSFVMFILLIVIIIFHRNNIIRIKNKTENKITWM